MTVPPRGVAIRQPHRGWTARRPFLALILASALVVGFTVVIAPAASAAGCTGNEVVCENQLPGTPQSVWDVDGAGDPSIQGFATQMSVNRGQTIQFKINTPASAYTIEIYRLGYYQGNGARKVADVTPSATLPQAQSACATDPETEIYDCGTWGVSASWAVPATAVSGVYIARLHRADLNDSSHIPFIVRNDASTSQVVFQTSDSTWQAYNAFGGSDFYKGVSNGRAYKISYNRPFATRDGVEARDYLFANEYPMIRFLESNGYDMSYISSLDTDIRGSLLTNHKTFVSVGHDEYWSAGQRTSVENARDAGVNLAFFSGNEVYWKTRWEPSQDGSNTANRTLVCYKDTWANAPLDPVATTATWRDPRFGDNGHGPENALTGTAYMSNNTDLPITVSADEGRLRLWRNTPLATQTAGTSTALALHTVGYESDEDLDNGYRPPGLIRLSTTTGAVPQYLQDFGTNTAPGTTTHHLTMYKAASGAIVFGAGTIQWAWGLDTNHDGTVEPVDARMQQATVNLLADMSANATTLISGLVPASKTTDTAAPTAVITAPSAGSTLTQGSMVTVTGSASDTGGGVVAGIEVSLDAGATWHPATGRGSFTYTGVLAGSGPSVIRARAIDDSGNIQSPANAAAVTATCPCSIFGDAVPGTPAANDSSPVTLGVNFTSSANGFVTGLRFYKGPGNTGTHTGTLYRADGTVLTSVTFTNETATGWQTASFPSAVPISAGTTYVAAYVAPSGHYSADSQYFAYTGKTAGSLTALGGPGTTNGVYTSGSGMPGSSYGQTNYYVDVLYSATDPTPLGVIANTPLDGSTSVPTTASVTATFSRDAQPSSIAMTVSNASNDQVTGSTTYDAASRTVRFTPTQPLATATTYTVRLTASADVVGPMSTPAVWSFTTNQPDAVPGVCPCSLFNDSDTPTVLAANDPNSVELGVAFSADTAGTLIGVRFYKAAGNTGNHGISLWAPDGSQLATATVPSESTTGWQTALFTAPVNITAGITYVASYRAPVGRYSYDAAGLSLPRDRTPLHTVANAGRYTYGAGAPASTSGSNYFVDPVFTVAPGAAPTVAILTPANQTTSVSVSSAISVRFDTSVQPGSTSITLTDPTGAVVPGITGNGLVGPTASFTPSAPLSAGTVYTITVSGAKNLGGTPMPAPVISTFTTSGLSVCPCSLLPSSAIPVVSDSTDASAISVGLRFTPEVDGFITGLRYYRDAANVGTHTGSLYTSTGTVLATLTYPTGNPGWQTASFASPVPVTGGVTYVASTFMPSGHYSVASAFFTSPVVNSPLTGTLGTYTYGADTFPVSSWKDSYYYVDVNFTPQDTAPPAVSTRNPDGSVLVQPDSAVSATFARGIDPASLQMTVKNATNAPVAGTVTYNAAAATATFQPSGPLPLGTAFTASVSASSSAGVPMAAPTTWQFSTVAAPPQGDAFSLYAATDAPAIAAWTDPGPVTVGMKFSSTQSGSVTAVKFFAADGNTGPYAVSIWSTDGTKLGSGKAFGNATGWKAVLLDAPVAISAGTTYVASYRGASGHYALTTAGLASGKTSGPLQIPSTGGSYSYPDAFPANSTGDDFFVDVVVVVPSGGSTTTAPGTPTAVSALAGDGSATASWTAPADGGSQITRYTVTPFIGSTAQAPMTATGTTATIDGLTNGTAYTFTVTATNAVGTGGPSAASNSVTPAAVPGVPTGVSATAGNASATISWTAPADGGSPITSYTVTPFIGSTAQATTTATGSTAAVAGLTNGTAYTFTVSATNAMGASAASTASNSVTPTTVPGAPTTVTAAAGNASATVSWTAPANNGSAISSYTITPFVGTTAQTATTITGNPPVTNTTITGLTNGSTYTFRVVATNGIGTGAASTPSNSVTLPTTAPSVPTGLTATAGNASATVNWTAPADGGSVITRYTITPFIGTVAQAARTVTGVNGTPPVTTLSVTGLTNGTAYTFKVTATNVVGTSAASTASNAVTPAGVPGAPTGVTATAGNASATVSWTAPANGSGITSYTITPFIGTTAQTPTTITGNPPVTNTTITGLTNGTAYTFRVTATNAVGTGAASTASTAVTPATVPAAPTGVTATAGNASATVSWTAPANGGSGITSYTITPFIGTTAQTARTVTGAPPVTTLSVTGLTNGTAYTFKVTATNAKGTGSASAASNAVTPFVPTFVQQLSTHSGVATSIAATPAANITAGNRLVVLVGVKNAASTTAQSVTDSAGNTYVRVLQRRAADNTEMTVWTAPITVGGGTKPTITATPSGSAALGIQVLEYSGLSTIADATAVDRSTSATGTTGLVAATVQSGATAATTAANQLAIGFYLDGGFGRTLASGSGFILRSNVSPATDMEFLAEDQISALGARPNAGAQTGAGARTTWLMATVVFKHA